jgi:hypothetical protein
MTDEVPTVEEQRAALAAEYTKLNARIEALTQAKAVVRDDLIALGAGPAGNVKVTISQSKRLNAVRFMSAYPVEEHPDYYESKPIAAMAKALNDASVYDLDAPSVRIVES